MIRSLFFVNVKLDVQIVHTPGVIEDLDHKEINGALVCKPEAQRITANDGID
jgi:hypothetical protein